MQVKAQANRDKVCHIETNLNHHALCRPWRSAEVVEVPEIKFPFQTNTETSVHVEV